MSAIAMDAVITSTILHIPYVAAVAMSPGRTTQILSRVLSAWSLRNIIMFRFTGDLEYTAVIASASVCSRVCSSMAVPM